MIREHPTPLPWAVWQLSPDSDEQQRHIITTADGEQEITGIVYREADAQHILRCVNAHDRLLEALVACELQLREYVEWHHTNAGGCSVEIEFAWEQARDAIAEATSDPQPEALHVERPAGIRRESVFDTAPFPCHCPAPTGNSSAKEAEPEMIGLHFTGDDWVCGCGNQPHLDGFQPCLKTGKLVEPTLGGWTDGELYRCMRCNSIIAWESSRDRGRITGTTAPEFLAQREP